nr:peptide deformylase [uncultured Solibaculum sp.]
MALRKIVIGNPYFLRRKCRPVLEVNDSIRQMLDDMAETMYHTGNGAGLAACQVGILRRMVVIDMGDGLIKMVNPKLVEAKGRQKCVEGCLSFPGRWGKTIRPAVVTVQYQDENGRKREIVGKGDLAKCLCHEIDHLNGVVFLDRVVQWLR